MHTSLLSAATQCVYVHVYWSDGRRCVMVTIRSIHMHYTHSRRLNAYTSCKYETVAQRTYCWSTKALRHGFESPKMSKLAQTNSPLRILKLNHCQATGIYTTVSAGSSSREWGLGGVPRPTPTLLLRTYLTILPPGPIISAGWYNWSGWQNG